MQSFIKSIANILCAISLTACAIGSQTHTVNNDQLPMYGGIDRQADPELQAADNKLIDTLVQKYGSPEAAERSMVELGTRYFQGGNYVMAMRKFNQAWLLDPNSPDAYWGFAIIYDDQGKSCEAKRMIDRALQLNLTRPVALADAGRIYTYCAVSNESLNETDRRLYFEQSEELYSRAVSMAPTNQYLFGSWAIAHYWQGDYADAWKMLKKQRALGGTPGEDFLSLLRAKMAEQPS